MHYDVGGSGGPVITCLLGWLPLRLPCWEWSHVFTTGNTTLLSGWLPIIDKSSSWRKQSDSFQLLLDVSKATTCIGVNWEKDTATCLSFDRVSTMQIQVTSL